MNSYDVTIRGAGIFGLSIAWVCVQRGARVQVVDPFGPGSGASGGVVGALAPHVPEQWVPKKQFQFESLILAEPFWAEVEDITGQSSGYTRAGRVQLIADDAGLALAHDRHDKAKELWQGKAVWDVTKSSGGWDVQSKSGWFVRDSLSAHLHPRRACAALVEVLQRHGVDVIARPEGTTNATVWATGAAGLDELSQGRSRIMGQGIKGQAALLDANRAGMPQLYVEELHVIPHLDGTVAVGSTTERFYDDPSSTDQLLEDIIEKTRRVVPELANAEVLERWAGLRPRSRTRAPMLGGYPDRPGHFVANGGFKIGFGMAPKLAHVMADLVLDGHNTIADDFDVIASM
ncbi:MAG: FAD-dependent oxidoreductase [Aliishimia sp.]